MTLVSRLPRAPLVLAVVLIALPTPAVAAGTAPTCDGREATLVGTDGDDVLTGTDGPDVIVALDGRDEIAAGAGDDVVCAGPGDFVDLPDVEGVRSEHVDGGDGNDRLFGEAGLRRDRRGRRR